MREFFDDRKAAITVYLDQFAARIKPRLGAVNPLGPEALTRLVEYAREGKMIRGGLAGLGQGLFAGSCDENADRLGAVMEFFQSALLVHDDIMDRDLTRRGQPAMHARYAGDLRAVAAAEPDRTGESLSICVGDIAFFLGFEILASLDVDSVLVQRLFRLCSTEMTVVGLGQMQDIRLGVLPSEATQEDILSLYVHKTGRYTFSMPLTAGAILGGASDEEVKVLSELGEVLGVIFQIKDDELGIFGSFEEIGKPVGTDLSEGKQTIFYSLLAKRLQGEEKARLLSLRGTDVVPLSEVEFVRRALQSSGVFKEVQALIEVFHQRARTLLAALTTLDPGYGRILSAFVDYNLSRTT